MPFFGGGFLSFVIGQAGRVSSACQDQGACSDGGFVRKAVTGTAVVDGSWGSMKQLSKGVM
jgi:hypothetical protein